MNPHKSIWMTKVEQIIWGFTLCPVLFISGIKYLGNADLI